MARTDGRLEAGSKLRVSARAWNRAQDAADIVLGARPGFEADGIQGPQAPYTAVLCKSSVTVARWGILAINGVETAPTGPAGGQFASMPVLQGGTPTTGTMAFGVAVEPIASGSIGRVAVAGVVQCKLDVVHADHKFAKAKATTEELQTDHGGSALVIWKESGTGAGKWGLVRLAAGSPTGIDVVKDVTLGPTGLSFTRERIWIHGSTGITGTTIGTTGC